MDNASQLTLNSTTFIPVVGHAEYSGAHGAIIHHGVRDVTPETISGIASIHVDFGDLAVSGMITAYIAR